MSKAPPPILLQLLLVEAVVAVASRAVVALVEIAVAAVVVDGLVPRSRTAPALQRSQPLLLLQSPSPQLLRVGEKLRVSLPWQLQSRLSPRPV
jgi:hypothetical protein